MHVFIEHNFILKHYKTFFSICGGSFPILLSLNVQFFPRIHNFWFYGNFWILLYYNSPLISAVWHGLGQQLEIVTSSKIWRKLFQYFKDQPEHLYSLGKLAPYGSVSKPNNQAPTITRWPDYWHVYSSVPMTALYEIFVYRSSGLGTCAQRAMNCNIYQTRVIPRK